MGLTTVDSDSFLSAGDLTEGRNVSGTVAFEQPTDDDSLQLIFEAGFQDNIELVFNLSE